jgi:formylglycine-generating enzyme required for sulfatase activity
MVRHHYSRRYPTASEALNALDGMTSASPPSPALTISMEPVAPASPLPGHLRNWLQKLFGEDRLVQDGVAFPALSVFTFQTVQVNKRGEITTRKSGKAKYFREDLGNSVTLDMVAIPAGKFVMGSPRSEEEWDDGEEEWDDSEGPQRTVAVSKFFMGRFPVTQEQYQAIMGKNPSYFKGTNRPVETVSWNDAVAFCKKLSELTKRTYRLPSEAEWEYACRAGTTTPFHVGTTITTALANYDGNYTYGSELKGVYRRKTTEVDCFIPNAFGLHDMHGNVWEWCQDIWHNNYEDAPTHCLAWMEGSTEEKRVIRGGSWDGHPEYCRSAARDLNTRDNSFSYIGFRLVCAGAAGLPG